MRCFFFHKKAVLAAKRPEIRLIFKAESLESGLFRALWARLCHTPSAPAVEAEKISNGQQRTDSVGVLLDASIPRFGVPHIKLDSFENVLDLTSDACLESLQLTLSGILTHCFQTPRPTGNHIVSS